MNDAFRPLSLRQRTLLWLFPRRCVWCGKVTEPTEPLCPACAEKPPETARRGLPVSAAVCLFCGSARPCACRLRAPLLWCYGYHSPGRRVFLDLKFRGKRAAAADLALTMTEALRRCEEAGPFVDAAVCCVPMTAAQLKRRGYNQSALLGRACARGLGLRWEPGLLRKVAETDEQHRLPGPQRFQNVDGAFAAADPDRLRDRKILLVDDVTTTGATLRECVRALREAGAATVFCLTFLGSDGPAAEPEQNEGSCRNDESV
ncbi:MAG: hypothetical protein LBJ11_04380 [Oscillospiraceae bacterium]|jgi:ComF family protein|nr:hypothetical protein [Oscillospiraceae bacterium]